jgi:hypothetical protein
MPEQVSVAMAEIAGAMREGLLALAVGAGTGGEARRDPAPVADRAGSAPERADDFVGAAAIAEQAVVEAGEPALVSVSAGRRRRSCQRPREGSRDPRRAGRSAQCRSSGRRRRGRGSSCRGRAAPPRPACRPARTCPTCRTPAGRRPGRAPRRSACGGVGRKGLRDVLRQVLPLPGHGGAPGRPAHAGTAGATRAGRGGRARRPTRRLQDGGDPLDQPVPVADVGAGCPPARRGPAPRRRRAAHLRDGPRDRQAGCLLHAGSCQPAGAARGRQRRLVPAARSSGSTATPPSSTTTSGRRRAGTAPGPSARSAHLRPRRDRPWRSCASAPLHLEIRAAWREVWPAAGSGAAGPPTPGRGGRQPRRRRHGDPDCRFRSPSVGSPSVGVGSAGSG